MVFFDKKYIILIKRLYEAKQGYDARKLLRVFQEKNWQKGDLDHVTKLLRSTGDILRKQDSGRPHAPMKLQIWF